MPNAVLPILLKTGALPAAPLPPAGKRRFELDAWDYFHITVNKLQTPPFLLVLFRFLFSSLDMAADGAKLNQAHTAFLGLHSRHVSTAPGDMTLLNTLIAIPLQFIVYDAGYSIFHRFLHWAPVYPWIHKHHHRQVAPMRGLDDAINTHWVRRPAASARLHISTLLHYFLMPSYNFSSYFGFVAV